MNDEFDSRYFEIVAAEWLQNTAEQTEDTDKKSFVKCVTMSY